MLNSPRTKNLNKKVRIGIVVVAWIIYLLIGMFGGGGSGSTTHNTATNTNTASNTAIEQTASTITIPSTNDSKTT